MKTITLITNLNILNFEDTLKLSKKLSRIGLDRVQIREKNIPSSILRKFIKKMKDSTDDSCELILNGNLDLAIKYNLDGVHFPENYLINKKLDKQDLITGRSIHKNTILDKHQNYFDYFHLGPVFKTLSHPGEETINEEKTKYFMFIPANHITIKPLKAISTDVPRSGWEITRKIGTIRTTIGTMMLVNLFTMCIWAR